MTPTHDDIAQRAYDLYLQSGCVHGRCDENWRRAQHDLHEQGTVACQAEHRRNDTFAPDAIPVRDTQES